MMDFIAKPFGVLMEFIYNTLAFQNYGVAIILFTVFVRILMLPLSVKQQKNMERQQAIMPELDALRKQYAGDTRKLQEEQQNLYMKHRINPYSGCLPMLIQFPLIIIIYRIIRQPLTFIAGFSKSTISALAAIVNTSPDNEIVINNFFLSHPEQLADGVTQGQLINLKFLHIFDLGLTPNWRVWSYGSEWKTYLPLLLIPFLAVGTSYLQQYVSVMISNGGKKQKKDKTDPTASAMNGMMKVMPLMSFFFAFILPAGLGMYWSVGNILGIAQTFLVKKVFSKKKEESL